MAKTKSAPFVFDEIADFLASCPTTEQWLKFRPSEAAQERARELLYKNNAGTLNDEEKRELEEISHAEILMRLVKARVRAKQAS